MKILRETYGESILVFFFPGIVAWMIALAGFSIPLDKGNNLLVFTSFWFMLEIALFLFLVKDIKSRKGVYGNILGCAAYTLAGVLGTFSGSFLSFNGVGFSDESDDEDAQRMYFAGVAIVSVLIAVVVIFFGVLLKILPVILAWAFFLLYALQAIFGG